MKHHFLVTVSDLDGSRHYTLPKSLKRRVRIALLIIVAAVAGSIIYNAWQHQQVESLHSDNARLEREASVLQGRNTRLLREHLAQQRLVRAVSGELRVIERLIGLRKDDDADSDATDDLATRAELAAFGARQESVLMHNIPNGYPTELKYITSGYGPRVHPITKRNHFHNGVDLRTRGQVAVRTTADGVVRAANYSKLNGNRIIVRHNFGFESYYAHLYKMSVEPGDVLRKGDVVGISGNSGHSTGPHLHYEIRYLGKPLDPGAFLKWQLGSNEIFTQVEEVKWPSLINLINQRITHPTFQLSQQDPISTDTSK